MTRIRRTLAVTGAVLAVVVATVLATANGAYAAGPTATFSKTSSWSTGYEGRFTITNGGTTTLAGWTVEFDLPAGTTVGTYWDALLRSSNGGHYVFGNREYNGTLTPGASASFGFVASGTASPTGCKLNGAACGGAPGPTASSPSPTRTPTSSPTSSPTTPPPLPPPPGSARVAPYIDITMDRPTLVDVARATGQKVFTLAFVLGSAAGCDPKWGGTINLDEPRIVHQIRDLRALGGDVVVAFGGAVSPYLESVCGSVDALAGAYRRVVDTLNIRHLDVDIEASVPIDTMNKALARVQRDRPNTTLSFTLMVQGDDFGLTPALGTDLLRNAKQNGVRVDVVNPMTMEFGTSRPNWGDAVIAAAESTLRQLREIWPEKTDAALKRMLGVTPMIGRNFNGKIFTQSHANQLVSWANTNHVGRLAFWSVGRDNGSCPGGGVSPTCSSISQSLYEFTTIFSRFTG